MSKISTLKKLLSGLPPGQARFFPPMLCRTTRELPDAQGWLFELKLDGYRALAIKDGERMSLVSRNNKHLPYPEILEKIRALPVESAVLDGELVALDENGLPSFQGLQNTRTIGRNCRLCLYAFDLLHLNGRDLVSLPIETRKEFLGQVLRKTGVLLCQSFDCDGEALLAEVKKRNLEGIVAKRRGSVYRGGDRDGTWLKFKVHRQQEFIVGGYAPGNPLESILVGYLDGKDLVFAGNVHAGLNRFSRVAVFEALQRWKQDACPFVNLPEKRRDRWGEGITAKDMGKYVWLKPQVRVGIEFVEWTAERRLRHPRLLAF